MDPSAFADLQEGLLYFFGPVLVTTMFLLIAGGILSAIGVAALNLAGRLAR